MDASEVRLPAEKCGRRCPCPPASQPMVECLAIGTIALLVESSIHQVFQGDADPHRLAAGLRHENNEHVLLTIDPECGAAGAGPAHLADRPFVRTDARVGAHREAEAEPKSKARQII